MNIIKRAVYVGGLLCGIAYVHASDDEADVAAEPKPLRRSQSQRMAESVCELQMLYCKVKSENYFHHIHNNTNIERVTKLDNQQPPLDNQPASQD